MADVSMPDAIVVWMDSAGWGLHHLRWHVERMWDRLPPPAIAWAQSQGWSRYPLQEGEERNGLAFLAMHRFMIRTLTAEFPAHVALFAGWVSPPTDPNDLDDPIPANSPIPGPFSADMATSITRIGTMLDTFDGDDGLGLYVQTGWRPYPNNPTRRSADPSSGLHNYIHGRFSDELSDINMGDPFVNLANQRFWRFHGWIESRWSAYRTASGRSETDAAYEAALEEAEHHMMRVMPMLVPEADLVPIPLDIRLMVSRTLVSR